MPRTFDRRFQPKNDKDPNRFGTDFNDPMGAISEGAQLAGTQFRDNLVRIIKDTTGIDLTGVVEFMDWLSEQVGLVMAGFGAAWQALLDGIVNLWLNTTESVGAFVENVLDTFGEVFGITKGNVLSTANASIATYASLATSAGGDYDEFDYTSAAELPSGTYAQLLYGPGAGTYGPNGIGHLVWKTAGFSFREVVYRRSDTTLAQDNGVVTSVWLTKIKNPFFADSFGYLCGRMANDGSDTYVRASIDNNQARIEVVVAGVGTQLGAAVDITPTAGDVFRFFYGTTAHPRRFWLRQGSVTILTRDDGLADGTGSISSLGAGFRSVGFGTKVGQYAVFTQNPGPSLAGWTWAPQTTA
jgi:hypothetical protein